MAILKVFSPGLGTDVLRWSLYDSPALYNSYLTKERGWKRRVIETHTRNTDGKDLTRNEVLWSNQGSVPFPLRLGMMCSTYSRTTPKSCSRRKTKA